MAAASGGAVGDFVLRFIGDTASLDEAYAKVRQGTGVLDSTGQALGRNAAGWEKMGTTAAQAGRQTVAASTQAAGAQKLYNAAIFEATGRLVPLRESLQITNKTLLETAFDWRFAGTTASIAGDQAILAGGQFAAGAEKAALGSRHAREEVALLGAATGVRLPRALRGFAAEIPALGAALSGLFEVTAVLFFIDALKQGGDALGTWIADTFIYTEAMKEADKALIDSNKRVSEHVLKLKELKKEYELFGLTGPRKTKAEFMQLTAEVDKNEAALRNAQNVMYAYRKSIDETTKAQNDKAAADATELKALLDVQKQQQANFSKQYDKETADEVNALAAARVAAAKAVGEAQIELERQQARARLNLVKDNSLEEGVIESRAAQQRYELELHTLERQQAIAHSKGAEGVAEVERIQGEIEALTARHAATILQQYTDMMTKARAIVAKPIKLETFEGAFATIDPVTGKFEKLGEIITDATTKAELLERAGKALGVTFSGELFAALEKARDGFQDLATSGMMTATDRMQAQIVVLKTQIAYMRSLGEDTKYLEKAMNGLETQYDKLTGKTDKTSLRQMHVVQVLKTLSKQSTSTKDVLHNLGEIGSEALDSMAAAFQQSVANAILSQGSFAQAMQKATAEVLASIAAQAAMYALFEVASGFAALARYDYPAATNHFTAAAEYAAAAVLAGIGARLINPKDSSAGGSSGGGDASSEGIQTTGSAGQPAQQPAQQQNVITHFAAGGLVTGPTLAVIGDSMRASGQREAAIPLDDPQAVRAIVEALGGGGGGNFVVNVNKGIVSPDNLKKVLHQISRGVNRGKMHLKASTTYRVNRRSQ